MNTADLRNLFASEPYKDMIEELNKQISFKISEPEDQTTEIIILSLDVEMLKKANLTLTEIQVCIVERKSELLNYSIRKHLQLNNIKTEQEYPEGEEQDEEGSDKVNFGYGKGFILTNAIEYILANKGKKDLLEYLKKIRIPYAPKYAKQILMEFMV